MDGCAAFLLIVATLICMDLPLTRPLLLFMVGVQHKLCLWTPLLHLADTLTGILFK